jgi:peptide/nickel transport system substrate-binding protein
MAETKRSRWRARVRAVMALTVAVGALAMGGCAADQGTTETAATRDNAGLVSVQERPRTGGQLNYGLSAETNGWNPATNQWAGPGLTVARTFFDTLTAFDEELRIHPYLAESVTPNESFTEWRITLRPGITFHNGEPVTAEAVRRNQTYLRASSITGHAYTPVDSFTAVDDRTLVVRMNRPWATYPMSLATQIGVVAEPDWLESNDSLHPIGTGPFVFDRWTVDAELTVKKNPNYWQRDRDGVPYPYLDAVKFVVLGDSGARLGALEAGNVDVIQSAPLGRLADLQRRAKAGELQVFAKTNAETSESFVMLNNRSALFRDVEARQALAYATDRQAVADTVTQGLNQPASGPFAPTSRWYAESGYPGYDPVRAKELVDRVKARNGGRFEFRLWGPPDPVLQQSLQLLQQQWAAVGIDARIQAIEQATMIVGVVTGGYDAVLWSQFDAPHPANDIVWWAPEIVKDPPAFTLNFARYADDATGAALQKLLATTDEAEIRRQLQVVQQRMGEQVPYVWLYHTQVTFIADDSVVNLVDYTLPDGAKGIDQMQGSHPLYQVWRR